MKKKFRFIAILILVLSLLLCACGKISEDEPKQTTMPAEAIVEATEIKVEVELDTEWLSNTAIDEAYACLFPSESEINVEKAQEILLPLVEAGNAEAQYYWGYICDFLLVDNTGEQEKESLYWYTLSAEQGFPKAYLAASVNSYIESGERADELLELSRQAGLFEMTPAELLADGCNFVAYYYLGNNDYPSAAEWFLKAAELGCTDAMSSYGQMHYYKMGVEQDYIIATDWLLKAAETGDINAMYVYWLVLSDLKVTDVLIDQEYTSTFDNYKAAAEAGDPEAMYRIGELHDRAYNRGLEKNRKTALEWYRKAADAGHVLSMFIMGRVYREGGQGIKRDYALAMEWYQKAADAGSYMAMEEIASMYYLGQGVEQNSATADEWWSKADNLTNGDYYTHEMDYYTYRGMIIRDAMTWLEKAANKGHAASMYEIGAYFDNRPSIHANEFVFDILFCPIYGEKVEEWYLKAVDAGSVTTMYKLGERHRFYENYDEAMTWYIKAYAAGYEEAAEEIMEMLAENQGVNVYFEHYGELISTNP